MDLRSIYLANGVGIFILLMLSYVSRTKILRHRAEDRVYSFMVIGVMLACLMEALSYTLDGKVFPGARILNYAANAFLYSVNLLLPFCVLVYIDLADYGDVSRIWKCYKPQIIIGVVMFCVNIVNFFNPVSYIITAQNIYERRPVSYVYYIIIMYYCLTGLIHMRRYEKENGAKAFFNINVFLIPIMIGVGLQFLFYGLSVAWLTAALGLAGLFMMQQNEMAYIDSLVDTYNRQYLNHILSAWISRGKKFAGVMIDIDHFKSINDNFGHSEGDNALKTIADILKKSRKDREWVCRFAGDEFIVLKLSDDPDGLGPYMREAEGLLAEYNRGNPPYQLSISYGFGFYVSGSIDSLMKEMDKKMYEMKIRHHDAAAS